jgi:4-amino-4-deoxy-L-arabinose transferase-like glycosyltransferase
LADLRLPLVWWTVLVAVSLAVRPPIPVDETRYLSVAWEMWASGDLLVPALNGVAYSHKPPLLFWLIHAGWALFGVQSWWPRLVPALSALAAVWLTALLARELWPERRALPARAGAVVQGFLLCVVLVTMLLFDPLLMACTALADLGLVRAARRGSVGAWGLAGLGIGLGVLAKGPVILVPILPVILAGPWWASGLREPGTGAPRGEHRDADPPAGPGPAHWFAGALGALALGAALAGAWALPAAHAGGPEYARAILYGQTAGRLADSFAHQRPWWWYLPLLPVVFYPYSFCPSVYRGIYRMVSREAGRLRAVASEPGVRFALAGTVPAFVAFSLISGKQPHYLAPLLPAAALLVARLLELVPRPGRRDLVLPVLFPLVVAVGLTAIPGVAGLAGLPGWTSELSPGAGLLLGATVVVAAFFLGRWRLSPHRNLGVLSVAVVIGIYLALSPALVEPFDLKPVADYVHMAERRGRPVAHVGHYEGELHFLGRLRRPFAEIDAAGAARWIADHPDGLVIVHYGDPDSVDLSAAVFVHPSRGQTLAVWDRESFAGGAVLSGW